MGEQYLLGQQLGNYRLTRLLGRGSFAQVYLAEHLHLSTLAAIKVLPPNLLHEDLERFRSEARIIAHLVHPHIVPVLEFGIEGHCPFLVMRYASGGTLRHRYPRECQLPLPPLVAYVKDIASALQYAHDQRLIHRDVKPENMLIGSHQEILLSDFGIALMAHSTRQQNSQEIAGTASYMAPEQLQGRARPASDQYALGMVVYEWLTGTLPFKGTLSEVISQHLSTEPVPPHVHQPTIPLGVEQVVLKALAKDPQQRFRTVWEFATALERAACAEATNGSTILTREPPAPLAFERHTPFLVVGESASDPTEVSSSQEDTPPTIMVTPTQKERKKLALSRRTLLSGITLTGLAGVGIVAGVLVWRPSQRVPPARTPSPSIPTSPPLGTTRFIYPGHHNDVEAAAWSPDSTRIASASKDKTVQVWNSTDGGNALIYTGHKNTVDAVVWSPDGARIASASLDKTVQIWNAADGGDTFTYTGHKSPVAAVVWSPDGTRLASADYNHSIQVWSATGGTLIFHCGGHSGKVWALAWSPDGKYLASASADATARIWDATTGQNTVTYTGHAADVDAVAWSPDSKRISSCSYDKTVQVWDASNGDNPFIYQGHRELVWWSAWSPDGQRIVSVSNDRTAQVWDASNGGHPFIYQDQNVDLFFVAWSPDGTRIVSGGAENAVYVWQAM